MKRQRRQKSKKKKKKRKKQAAPTAEDVHAVYDRGVALAKRGDHDRARLQFDRVLRLQPGHSRALNNLGALHAAAGQMDRALEYHLAALRADPEYTHALQNVCKLLIGLRRFDEALGYVQRLLQGDASSGPAWVLTAAVLNGLRRVDGAIDAMEKALELCPKSDSAWTQFGMILESQGRIDEAVQAFRVATELNRYNAEAWARLGSVVNMQHDPETAIDCCRIAIGLQPDNSLGYERLAAILEKANRLEEAQAVLNDSLQINPGSPITNCRQAELDFRSGRYRESLERLERAAALSASVESLPGYHSLMGRAHHKLGDFPRAFAAFQKANEIDMSSPHAKRVEVTTRRDLEMTAAIRQWFTAERVQTWGRVDGDACPMPVFLVGFPRSGTTLMDTILSSHSAIVTLDEKPALERVVAPLVSSEEGLDRLARLAPPEIATLRAEYWSHVREYLGDEAPVVIDKLPLNIILLGVIYRLFPEARIIVALRHPLDSILSCFMQRFLLNTKMFNFLTLEGAASYYALVMGLYRHFRDVLPLAYHTYRYEDVLEDFDGEVAGLLGFLGLEWEDGVRDYRATASQRVISTPSYTEVVRPLHREAMYRWKSYRSELAGIVPLVEPFVRAFGYETARRQPISEMPLKSSAESSMALL